MSLLLIAAICMAVLALAYWLYGGMLARLFGLRADAETPAVKMRDEVDYVPIPPKFLLGQHFSAIAAAGPIVGPILAGAMFGWVPALLWIVLGSIFVGGVHDMSALVASIRHRARSIAEVVREHMTRRSYVLFMIFVWLALVYIIVAFTDIVASSFVGAQKLENGLVVSGGGIASSSLIYLALPIIMGLLMRYAKLPLRWATLIFLPLVGVAIWVGQYLPLDLEQLMGLNDPQTMKIWEILFGIKSGHAVKLWDVLLLAYCFVASLVPMWLLLQPRGHLGGYFLFFALIGGLLGVIFGGGRATNPSFIAWTTPRGEMLAPLLFITVACGACSGFHALVASGTTSKQLRCETDAKPIGYGAMLLEALVAVVSLCCLMMLSPGSSLVKGSVQANFIYAQGIGRFLEVIGVPAAFGISFGLLAFTTFVYDTLDVCTRLGRYIIQELTGWHGQVGRWFGTALTAGLPLFFVMQTVLDASGRPVPAWKVFWSLFGASNQLLAALTLLGVTVWLYRTHRRRWAWLVSGLPAAFMYAMSMWALLRFLKVGFWKTGGFRLSTDPVTWVAVLLVGLALLLLVEAAKVIFQFRRGGPDGRVQVEAQVA